MLIVITVALNKTYFGKKYHGFKNGGIPTRSFFFFDMSGPSRDLYRSSQISTRPCQSPPSLLLRFHR